MKYEKDKKDIEERIKKFDQSRFVSDTWSSIINLLAYNLATIFGNPDNLREEYEKEISKYPDKKEITSLLLDIYKLIKDNPYKDVLGEMYMEIDLGNKYRGQFFTPYEVARLMTAMTFNKEGILKAIEERGMCSFLDPTCGSGVMLLANAERLSEEHIDYSKYGFFVGQDVDKLAALMCFIQLSLNEMPAIVCIGDTLSNPIVFKENGDPVIQEGQELWFTPKYIQNRYGIKVEYKDGKKKLLPAG